MLKYLSKVKFTPFTIFILLVFILGLIFVITNEPKPYNEGFGNKNYKCPNILIQKDNVIYLFNSNQVKVPGVNPIRFNNLEDYVEYINWQRNQGIECPILFLQRTFDAQGKSIYKVRPSPLNLQGGLDVNAPIDSYQKKDIVKLRDASRNDPPYNQNLYPGFDPDNQYIGENTPLDKLYHQNIDGKSPNPMDSNWGGGNFTQSLVDQGYYEKDVVTKPIMTNKISDSSNYKSSNSNSNNSVPIA